MTQNSHWLLILIALLFASAPAHARFGKSAGGNPSRSSGSAGSAHRANPVAQRPSSWASSRGVSGYGRFYNPWRFGYYSGAFVPMYGYGYGYYAPPPYLYGPAPEVATSRIREEPPAMRVTLGVEVTPYVGVERGGFGLGGTAMFEGQRWGISVGFQRIAAPSPEALGTFDTIGQFNAHLSFAFLTGKHGRLRAEAGGDTFFAPNLIVLAPTGGLSGSLWVGGPVALEASAMVTPWPIRQLDVRAGVVIGLGPVGLRAGWRTQVLDDQGLVDGVVNRDTFMGPYAGASRVLIRKVLVEVCPTTALPPRRARDSSFAVLTSMP